MLSDHIESQIYDKFPYPPTNQQKKIINFLSRFVSGEDNSKIFVLNGYAGTGKTTIISALSKVLNSLKIKYFLLAPTGRAAKVMARYSDKDALTIHKKIFRQKSQTENKFVLSHNKERGAIFIIDEASMISNGSYENVIFGSGQLLDDIFEYVNMGRDCKVIFIGDSAQLPPIGTLLSPALSQNTLECYAQCTTGEMSEAVRHELDSGILFNATTIRNHIEDNNISIPKINLGFKDVSRITGRDLLEVLEDSYAKYGVSNTIVITRSNKQANRINHGIRSRTLCQEEQIDSGDYVMIVRNNYFCKISDSVNVEEESEDFLANGDVAQIKRVKRYEERYGFRFADVTLKLIYSDDFELDCKIVLDALDSESPALTVQQQGELFARVEQDYMQIKQKGKRYKAMKEDPYLNAVQVKFAYAVTCHKAQGGEWDCVIIDRVLWEGHEMSLDLLRWLYTAVTRATKRLYLLNFDNRFFDDADNEE